jgi:hypothetical protein
LDVCVENAADKQQAKGGCDCCKRSNEIWTSDAACLLLVKVQLAVRHVAYFAERAYVPWVAVALARCIGKAATSARCEAIAFPAPGKLSRALA